MALKVDQNMSPKGIEILVTLTFCKLVSFIILPSFFGFRLMVKMYATQFGNDLESDEHTLKYLRD